MRSLLSARPPAAAAAPLTAAVQDMYRKVESELIKTLETRAINHPPFEDRADKGWSIIGTRSRGRRAGARVAHPRPAADGSLVQHRRIVTTFFLQLGAWWRAQPVRLVSERPPVSAGPSLTHPPESMVVAHNPSLYRRKHHTPRDYCSFLVRNGVSLPLDTCVPLLSAYEKVACGERVVGEAEVDKVQRAGRRVLEHVSQGWRQPVEVVG